MEAELQLGDLTVTVVFKEIKHIHLSVYPPTGRVRVAAPQHMNLDTIRVYVIAKMDWIKKQQNRFKEQERESQREYLDRESHYVWGIRYLLEIREGANQGVDFEHHRLVLSVRKGSGLEKRDAILSAWYRDTLRKAAAELIPEWQNTLGVEVTHCYIQHMKTRWGSCNPNKGSIRLNTELAKKPRECFEYVLVHEMMHLIEPSHNEVFVRLMDQHLPLWRLLREELNRAPLGHVEWEY